MKENNQSQTINLRNLFNDLLDESTHELDHLIKRANKFKEEEKELKVFEYQPHRQISDNIASFENDKTPKNILDLGNDQSSELKSKEESDIDINKLDRVIDNIMEIEKNEDRVRPHVDFEQKLDKHQRILSDEQAHNRQSSSNSNIGINKCDDLNIENFLGDDENQNTSNQSDDEFGHKIDQQFLHNFNEQFKHENIISGQEQEYDFVNESKSDENLIFDENKDFLIKDTKVKQDHNEKTAIDLLDSSSQNEEEKDNNKPFLDPLEQSDSDDQILNKSAPQSISQAFSPQDITAKLLSSLNKKSDLLQKNDDMLIFDDINDQTENSIILSPPFEPSKPNIKDSALNIEPKAIVLASSDDKEVSKCENTSYDIDSKEQIVNDILTNLFEEVKADLFPVRDLSSPEYLQMNNPMYNSVAIRKLAFESNKGIPTDFPVVDLYLKEVIDEIIKNESMFINNILTPIQRDPLEMLHLLRTADIGSYAHFDTYDYIIPILGVEIYLEIEKRKEQERQDLYENSDNSQSASESIAGKKFEIKFTLFIFHKIKSNVYRRYNTNRAQTHS